VRIKPIAVGLLLATSAHADCAAPPAIDTANARVDDMRTYLAALDAYASCLKAGSPGMTPPDRQAGIVTSRAVYATMQETVDLYNLAHKSQAP
jgi:hypothetical protein